VVGRAAKGIEHSHNNEANPDDKEGIFGGILARLLAPETLEGS